MKTLTFSLEAKNFQRKASVCKAFKLIFKLLAFIALFCSLGLITVFLFAETRDDVSISLLENLMYRASFILLGIGIGAISYILFWLSSYLFDLEGYYSKKAAQENQMVIRKIKEKAFCSGVRSEQLRKEHELLAVEESKRKGRNNSIFTPYP